MKRERKYPFALDETGNLIHIDEAINDKNINYHCIECGNIMIIREGKERIKYFAHENDNDNCSHESYLHKLAKIRFMQFFNSSNEFYITIPSKVICSNNNCPVNLPMACQWTINKTVNIKKEYKRCIDETKIEDFRADLLLPHVCKEKSILIEIYVTHKCTEEKINSNLPIIEIEIRHEEDIDHLISLFSSKDFFKRHPEYNELIKFYNFNHSDDTPPLEFQKNIYLFWIDSNKISHSDELVKCLNWDMLAPEKCQCLLASTQRITRDLAAYIAFKQGLDIEYCTICQHHSSNTASNQCSIKERMNAKKTKCIRFNPISNLKINSNQDIKILIPKSNRNIAKNNH